jgi:threonine dehydratase
MFNGRSTMIPGEWLIQAAERIAPYIYRTPFTYDPQNDFYIKWENHQVTGSFKARGALNKVLSLQDWERQRGLVTASAGNHGQGVALAGKLTGTPVIVFASEHATPAKVEAMQALGAEVRQVAGGYGEAEQAGLRYATERGSTWISPYNDGQVIAGQGTLGLEIVEQLDESRPVAWVVPAGGGGLVSGIGAAIHEKLPDRSTLVAVSSEASSFLHALYHTGTQDNTVELPSLADGLAGPVESGSITVPLVQEYVDEFVLVSEEAIRSAILYAWQHYAERIEGSAAAALTAVLSGKVMARPVILVLTGGNIQPDVHTRIIQSD